MWVLVILLSIGLEYVVVIGWEWYLFIVSIDIRHKALMLELGNFSYFN